MQRRRSSMADVARRAGVSAQTVSRVSNAHDNVEQSTRQRVLDAMRELGYRPNSAARALKAGHFRTIGVVTSYLSTFGTMRTLDEVVLAAANAGYAVTLIPIEASRGAVSGALDQLQEQAVDGIIATIEPHMLTSEGTPLPTDLPIVVVNSGLGESFTHVDTDQAAGARSATAHLLDLGHPTVWHLSGPSFSASARVRTEAWATTLAERGREIPAVLEGDWTAASGFELGQALARQPDVSAVFAANDQMALGCIQALRTRGRSIPEDVSVVGFDDMPEAAYLSPPLTTVRQDFVATGRACVKALLRELAAGPGTRENQHEQLVIGTELVVRGSTAPPR